MLPYPRPHSPLSPRVLRQRCQATQPLCSTAVLIGLIAVLLSDSRQGIAESASSSPWTELARLQRQALRQNGLDRQQLNEQSVRLRLSALLPQVRASWGRGTQWAYSPRSDSFNELVPDGDRSSYSISMSWDLGRLLFAAPELALSREAVRRSAQRTQLLLRISAVYLRRCRVAAGEQATRPADSPRAHETEALDLVLSALMGDEARPLRIAHCPSERIDPTPLLEALRLPLPTPAPSMDDRLEPSAEDSGEH